MMQSVLSVMVAVCVASLATASIAPIDLTMEEPSGPSTPTGTYDGTYWVTLSNKVRPGQNLTAKVSILKGSSTVHVTATLVRTMEREEVNITSSSIEVSPGDDTPLVLEVGADIVPGGTNWWEVNLAVVVEGMGPEVNFTHRAPLAYDSKACSIYVQTNKALYKPLQKVYARILAVDPNLKPLYTPFDVEIKDADSNLVMRKTNVMDPTGIVEISLSLPDRVPTGTWTIHVETECGSDEKTFTVDDYVLPKFEVDVMTPAYGVIDDENLSITIKSKYTFGKPVTDGEVWVEISPSYWSCQYQYNAGRDECRGKGSNNFIMRRGKLNSKGEFMFSTSIETLLDMVNQLNIYQRLDLAWYSFKVKATVLETNIARSETEEANYQFYPERHKVSFLGISPTNYKPDLPWTGYLEVLNQDDTKLSAALVKDFKLDVKVQYGVTEMRAPVVEDREREEENATLSQSDSSSSNTGDTASGTDEDIPELVERSIAPDVLYPGYPGGWYETTYHDIEVDTPLLLDEKGWAEFSFIPPAGASSIRIHVMFHNETTVSASMYLYPATSPSHSFLQLSMDPDNGRAKVGDTLKLTAVTTEPIEHLEYQILSKGMIISSSEISNTVASNNTEILIHLQQEMVPIVTVLAFYMRDDNHEVVTDAVTINVDGIFAKPLHVSFSKETVKPGEEVTLMLRQDVGDRASIVNVLSNDKSVTLLASGNDITESMVQDELFTYTFGYYSPWMRGIAICGMPYYYGGTTAAAVIRQAGVIMFTDSLLYGSYTSSDRTPSAGDDLLNEVAPQPDSNDGGMSESSEQKVDGAQPPARVRKNFPETWLWDTYIIPAMSEGVNITLTAPDTITSWPTTVFSLHPTVGLTIGAATASVTTFRDLSVQLELPSFATRYETFCFTASIFNYHEASLPVMVSLGTSDSYEILYTRRFGDSFREEFTAGTYNYINGQLDPDEIDSTMFCLRPTGLGEVPIRVNATTTVPGLSDGVERNIVVKAEGSPVASSEAFLVSVGDEEIEVDVSVLAGGVPGSQYITVNVVGNVLGTALDGIDELLRRPYGCGEQNMLNYAPNVFLLNFFNKTNTLTPERLATGEEYMFIGYTKANMYRDSETGGYSSFRNLASTKENPSLWLTDFIIKCFSLSRIVALPDPDLIGPSVEYIMSQQADDGYFVEVGRVFNTAMQGGVATSSTKGVALTAYTMLTLVSARDVFKDIDDSLVLKITESLEKADLFLQKQMDIIKDPYELCIATYVLNLIQSVESDNFYVKMMAAAHREEDDTLIYWKRSKVSSTNNQNWWARNNEEAITVEATAYCLLAMQVREATDSEFLPVVRWLTKQRRPYGDFGSTQATVTTLQALTSLPDTMYTNLGLPYSVKVSYPNHVDVIEITEETQQVVHRLDIPYEDPAPTSVKLSAEGTNVDAKGTVFTEVIMGQNIREIFQNPFFIVSHDLVPFKNNQGFGLNITIATTGEDSGGMAVVEVDIPTGFDPDLTIRSRFVSLVERKDTYMAIYIDSGVLGPKPIDIPIVMFGSADVALASTDSKFFLVYLYYERDTVVKVDYTVPLEDEFCEKVKNYDTCEFINFPETE